VKNTFDKTKLPLLGAGLGFRPPLKTGLFRNQSAVDWLEIIAEHYIETSPQKMEELDLLARHFTLVPHGIHLSIGSAEGPDPRHLERLAALIERLDPPWWSEHLAFVKSQDRYLGHLTPLPFSQEAVETVARNVERVREFISVPFILENITYMFRLPGDEMTESEFLNQVLAVADCGLLLDLTNVHTNAFNHGYDPYAFLDALPLERVVQCHVVGGHEKDGFLHDSHSAPVPEPVWKLLAYLHERTAVHGVLLERDDQIPPFQELEPELARIRTILAQPV